MGSAQDAQSAGADVRGGITDGSHVEYRGSAWSAAHGKNVQIDGSFVALDAVDSTERGTHLLVVPAKAYAAGAWFESDEYLICDGDLEDVALCPACGGAGSRFELEEFSYRKCLRCAA